MLRWWGCHTGCVASVLAVALVQPRPVCLHCVLCMASRHQGACWAQDWYIDCETARLERLGHTSTNDIYINGTHCTEWYTSFTYMACINGSIRYMAA